MITYDSFCRLKHVDIKTLSLCFADLNSSHVHVVFLYIPCHRKYSQSEYRKPVVFLTVLYPTFPSCAALILLTTVFSMTWYISHGLLHLFMVHKLAQRFVFTKKILVTC